MSQYLLFFVLGLSVGAVYAALTLGILVTYQGTSVINFAAAATATVPLYVFDELKRGRLTLPVPWLPGLRARARARRGRGQCSSAEAGRTAPRSQLPRRRQSRDGRVAVNPQRAASQSSPATERGRAIRVPHREPSIGRSASAGSQWTSPDRRTETGMLSANAESRGNKYHEVGLSGGGRGGGRSLIGSSASQGSAVAAATIMKVRQPVARSEVVDRRSNRLARALRRFGIGDQSLIIILVRDAESADAHVAMQAASKLGHVPVLVNVPSSERDAVDAASYVGSKGPSVVLACERGVASLRTAGVRVPVIGDGPGVRWWRQLEARESSASIEPS